MKALKILWPDVLDAVGITIGERVGRNYQDRGAERDGPDVFAPGLDGEVKHRLSTSLPEAIRDAIANARPGKTWFAVDYPTTGPRRTPVIAFDLDQFVAFVQRERVGANARGFEQGYQEALDDHGLVDLDIERKKRRA